jgi:hypothetical protein
LHRALLRLLRETRDPLGNREGASRSTKDRLDAVDPGAELRLGGVGASEGYRHLGYLQTKAGFNVRLGLPGLRGPEVAKLYAEGAAWLDGSAQPGEPL